MPHFFLPHSSVPNPLAKAVFQAYSRVLDQQSFHEEPRLDPTAICQKLLVEDPFAMEKLWQRFCQRFFQGFSQHFSQNFSPALAFDQTPTQTLPKGQKNEQSDQINKDPLASDQIKPDDVHPLTPGQQSRWLEKVAALIEQTVRTNVFVPSAKAIALKFCHADGMIEIFIDHPSFSGVLLKQGLVARGGVRWSLRPDFRTEALALMRAQILKNALVLPWGGKGAFWLKDPQDKDGLGAYQIFVSCILDLADQNHHQKITHPQFVRVYDGPDPYFVVAPDRGTASFSDHGNALAMQRGYWLGDAFASGGSSGYNHKDLAITARGVWVSVCHHLSGLLANTADGSLPGQPDLARDRTSMIPEDTIPEGVIPAGVIPETRPAQDGRPGTSTQTAQANENHRPLRVVGVGDLRGDIFGGGMTAHLIPCPPDILLIGAFNHEAIFIDPQPDPIQSAAERLRLVSTPHSRWRDFAAFGPGGSVYDRGQETIVLTPLAAELLNLPQTPLSPDLVIQSLLTLPVDVLWMGGIGTFIAPIEEEPLEDLANATVRVRPKDVRARVIAEGANLALTQMARVQLAKKGICVNTDGLDNAGGVACSDQEVNIKILLNGLVERKKILPDQRLHLLKACQEQVCTQVLTHLWIQHASISATLAAFQDLKETALAALDLLLQNPMPWLPKDDLCQMQQRWKDLFLGGKNQIPKDTQGPARPDLAVLTGCIKLRVRLDLTELWQTKAPPSTALKTLCEKLIASYFPQALSPWQDEFQTHPMAQDLGLMLAGNMLVDLLGPLALPAWHQANLKANQDGHGPMESWQDFLWRTVLVAEQENLPDWLDAWSQDAPLYNLSHTSFCLKIEALTALRHKVGNQLTRHEPSH
jgi:glutamate dehydrogenase